MNTPPADTLLDDPRYAATVDRVAYFLAELSRCRAERKAAAEPIEEGNETLPEAA
jgi:hypothetical protein